MAASIKIGQQLQGKLGKYLISLQIAPNVWTASISNAQNDKFILKTTDSTRYQYDQEKLVHESKMLSKFRSCPYIRPMLDETKSPHCLILRYLDIDMLSASNTKTFTTPEVKYVAKRVLLALQAIHEAGYTHADVKPSNIMANYGVGPCRFTDVQLIDLGDAMKIDPEDYLKVGLWGTHTGPAIFRSPESMLHMQWGQSTDIWSFGATIISLIWGNNFHIFQPDHADARSVDDELFEYHVLIRHLVFFGPTPATMVDLIAEEDTERWKLLAGANQRIIKDEGRKPWLAAQDECLTEEHRKFIWKIMKIDPSDRPTAKELLEDEWFHDID